MKKITYAMFCMAAIFLLTACGESSKKDNNTLVTNVEDYIADELSVQKGMVLFNEHCANCHNFEQTEIGPNLSGITTEVDKDWLVAFIKNPSETIKSGDKRAVENFNKYKMYMPSFAMLNEEEMENLLGFMNKFSAGEKKNKNQRKGGLLNPIPEKIPTSNLVLVVEDAFGVPANTEKSPLTRINKMETTKIDGRERPFIVDLRGTLYEVANDTVHTYLDLKSEFPKFIDTPGYGTGFGSFAFHPDFESNGLLYTTHTEPAKSGVADFALPDSIEVSMQWVLTEWKTEEPKSEIFKGAHRELLRIDMRTNVHGLQEIKFNPLARKGSADYGMLYAGIGDGGLANAGQPHLAGSNHTIWGSVIRIDPTGSTSGNKNYGVPMDNPYVGNSDAVPEIWCRGLRNPNRFSWDQTGSGKMFIATIGQHSVEEVNLGKPGADFGWPNREGTFLFDINSNPELVYPLPSDDLGYNYPVAQYDHDEGNAICGGYVYAGNDIPLLMGKYIFGDIPRGTLFFSNVADMKEGQQAPIHKLNLEYQGKSTTLFEMVREQRVDLRFGLGPNNSLYLFTKTDGKVYKVVDCKVNPTS